MGILLQFMLEDTPWGSLGPRSGLAALLVAQWAQSWAVVDFCNWDLQSLSTFAKCECIHISSKNHQGIADSPWALATLNVHGPTLPGEPGEITYADQRYAVQIT